MDLKLTNRLFVITGGSGGLGRGVASALLQEGAKVIIVARDTDKLSTFQKSYPEQIEYLAGDISEDKTIEEIYKMVGNRFLSGLVVNAGGPPAKSFIETEMTDWDSAYNSILRWKVKITKTFPPKAWRSLQLPPPTRITTSPFSSATALAATRWQNSPSA